MSRKQVALLLVAVAVVAFVAGKLGAASNKLGVVTGGATRAVAGSGAQEDLPRGWYAWRGLPVPGYFQKQSEEAARNPFSNAGPLSCTAAHFRHGFSDMQGPRTEIRVEWQRLGMPRQRVPAFDFYDKYADVNGQEVFTSWRASFVTITDCRQ
jgi:hypothetical protein